MLIRSQNKEMLMNLENLSGIEIMEKGAERCVIARDSNTAYLLGTYSDPQKALKVLDMIQETHAEAELAKGTIAELTKALREAPSTKENEKIAEITRKAFMDSMYFQMPQDDEVEG